MMTLLYAIVITFILGVYGLSIYSYYRDEEKKRGRK
tara:strand:- start:132 stop:239 length:108 start_codon:yes stop_codon:yes gene_type:complete